jgi:hypothetical protein
VESWGGRYVASGDVAAAAWLLGIPGDYPCFHISKQLVEPSRKRLAGIAQADTMPNYRRGGKGTMIDNDGQQVGAYHSQESDPA